jgi:hypothetical protein
MENFAIVETILRDRFDFYAEIRDGKELRDKVKFMLMTCAAFLAIYGAVMGASHGPLQAISSMIKLPILFLATLIITAPSLHFFNVLFGSKQTLLQTVGLILTGFTTTSVLLLSFAPITVFFMMTTSEYAFFKLLNVIFFAIAGGLGIVFLRQGIHLVTESGSAENVKARRTIFIIWVILYAFVGSQMAWTLSPFIGQPDSPFIIFRQVGGNFYADVISSITTLITR